MTKNFLDAATREADNLGGPYQKYVFRPLAAPFTILLAKTSLKPTSVTIFGLALGIMAAIFVANAETDQLFWGVIIWHLAKTCDFVDGNLARKKNQKTYAGKMLDGMVDIIVNIALLVGFGFHCGEPYKTACLAVALLYLLGHFGYFRYQSLHDLMTTNKRLEEKNAINKKIKAEQVNGRLRTLRLFCDNLATKTEANCIPLALVLGSLIDQPALITFTLCFCLALRGGINFFGSIFFTLLKLQIKR